MRPALATRPTRRLFLGAVVLLSSLLGGCAALSNPVADAVPVRQLPPEVFGRSKEDERTIPLPLLRQPPPDAYRLAPGDVVEVTIEGVPVAEVLPPLNVKELSHTPRPPRVSEDGTLVLPSIDPVKVEGLTLRE